jgi:uncharacterized protein YuzE
VPLYACGVSIRAGQYTFSHVTYDGPSDVLYAAVDRPRPGTRRETPEADVLRFDERGEFFGVILNNPRARLEREGAVKLTLPSGELVRVQGVEAAIRSGA